MITIAFMTNYTLDIPNIEKQKKTINSFYNKLKVNKKIKTFVFYDEKPLSQIKNEIKLFNGNTYNDYNIPGNKYIENLKNIELLKDAMFIKTNGLCDGYKKAIELCNTPYLFFLEHDWIFLDNIIHSLNDFIDVMENNKEINCILFNKINNYTQHYQKFYSSKNYKIPLLLTNRQSNNPNILRIEHAKKIRYPLIKKSGCSIHKNIEYSYIMNNMKIPNYCGGIECELTEFCNKNNNNIIVLGTYIYGKYGYDKTIIHSDGCNRTKLNKESIIERS